MKNRLVLIILLLAGAILFAGCTMPSTTPTPPVTSPYSVPTSGTPTPVPDTIKVATNPQYGQILVDANGMTLYYFAKDTPGYRTTACTGTCATIWPAFYAPSVAVTSPLMATDFQEFTRSDGAKQTTFLGWPLYYYAPDKTPGDTKGYGINNVWYVFSPTGVVTLAPTTPVPVPATTIKTTVPTTTRSSWGGGY